MFQEALPTNINEDTIKAALDASVQTHVCLTGISNIHPKVIEKDLRDIAKCGTIEAIVVAMNEIKSRWLNLGIFHAVNYNFEPTQGGAKNDVSVNIDVQECKPKKSLGLFTTDTSLPEVTVALENVLGGRYSVKGNYIPPASRVHSLSFSLLSNVPLIGQNAEYYIGRRTENKSFHLAHEERIEEVKATTQSRKSGLTSELAIGFQRRALLAKSKKEVPESFLQDFASNDKGYVRHDLHFSRVAYHANPFLYNMYPLPIHGCIFNLVNELAGGPMGGNFSFLKSEMQFTKYWPLGPFLSLQWSTKAAGIYPFKQSRIPLNDRLFLSNCHVRGFKSIGPSTLDSGQTNRFAATGGNALWATSINLNFPFLFFPNNGVASMHLFLNAGNLRMIEGRDALRDMYSWIRSCACSAGAGIVITRIPWFGSSPSGRFELNFSVPLGVDKAGNITLRNGSPNLFERVRFGLVWSSNYSF